MARLPYASPAQLQHTLRRSPFPQDTPAGNVFRMLAQAPPVGGAALGLIYSLLSETQLDPKVREIVILRVAERSAARYAFAQHSAIAASVGVNDDQISSLEQGLVPHALFGERESTAIKLADEAVHKAQVSDATFVRARQHFPPREIVELLLLIGCFRMMCRVVTITELEPEPSFGVDTLRRAQMSHTARSTQIKPSK